jgi:predicted GH43/DUF377 family glycosyl hydrolase
MKWRKLRRVFAPAGSESWARANASFPTAVLQGPSVIRVYYTALDDREFGQGGWVDLDAGDPTRVLDRSPGPILTVGEPGDFDDCGANPLSVVPFRGRRLMFYQGWQRTVRAPYAIFTGLAIEGADGRFEKHARVPVLDRTHDEPHIRAGAFALAEGEGLRLWYVSSSRWTRRGDDLRYSVDIRHATSADGIRWTADPRPCLAPDEARGEYAIGRPCVLAEGGRYRMWYSVRSHDAPYRIGYAESGDGLAWTRMDEEAGIACSEDGWDSQMICYPFVIRAAGRLLMFYNGNRHGRTGFGCAELETA